MMVILTHLLPYPLGNPTLMDMGLADVMVVAVAVVVAMAMAARRANMPCVGRPSPLSPHYFLQ